VQEEISSQVYAETTSAAPGTDIVFVFTAPPPEGGVPVQFVDCTTETKVLATRAMDARWLWPVPADLPSSLYRAEFGGGTDPVYFVIRSDRSERAGRILIVVPFLTWQAYNRLGEPGAGLYLSEQSDRAVRVTFSRPGGGPAGFWEERFYRWIRTAGRPIDFCSGIDLHSGAANLEQYDFLISAGHDEYWTLEMRDAVESFLDDGGNVAFFGANTCWWQARLEDDLRTLVCYRDAVADPVSSTDPGRTSVEWSAAPVARPENSLTGLSFRHGAGCWEKPEVMAEVGYTARFAQHWVFAGTGLQDGDEFALGAVGYETDAAEFIEIDAVPYATGRDGAPASLVILATADLTGWRAYGQGGYATMAIFRHGRGTVFNAATVNWGNRLDDPVVARITQNVIDRLSHRGALDGWQPIGSATGVVALAAAENHLFATTGGELLIRDFHGQNLAWRTVRHGPRILALAAGRESHYGRPVELYGLGDDGWILYRPPVGEAVPWQRLCPAVPGAIGLAVVFHGIFAVTADGGLWHHDLADLGGDGPTWTHRGEAQDVVAMAGMSGRLFALDRTGHLLTRDGTTGPAPWKELLDAEGATVLAAAAGRLVTVTAEGMLCWRDVVTASRP
jgi:N,N-dimethylformamidase beta subunit-like protein